MCDLKNEYLLNPCGTLSIPYWKNKIIIVPPDMVIIHEKKFNNQYKKFQRYFRLMHKLNDIKQIVINITKNIDIDEDKKELIRMINLCYHHQEIKVEEKDIEKWLKHPTFNENLWIKIEEKGKIVASGIAEYDEECKEGILEWIQVLPEHRSKGAGEAIVNSLLKKLKQLGAKFVTVSGNLDNNTNPEKLYRKCGFVGEDIWYICHR